MKRLIDQDEPTKKPKTEDDDLTRFQKNAILLQMKEYKRLYAQSQSELETLQLVAKDSKSLNLKFQVFLGQLQKAFSISEPLKVDNLASFFDLVVNRSPEIEQKTRERVEFELVESDLKQTIEKQQQEIDDLKMRDMQLKKKVDRLKLAPKSSEPESTPMVVEAPPAVADEEIQREVNELRLIADTRQQELQHLAHQNSILHQQIVQMTKKEVIIPPKTSLFQDLERDLRAKTKQVELLIDERKLYEASIVEENEKKLGLLKQELKKVGDETQRIRVARDGLQRQLDLQVNAKPNQNLAGLLESSKERIISLEAQLNRLLVSTSSAAGEVGLLNYFANGSYNDSNPWKWLENQLNAKETEINNLRSVMDSKPNDTQLLFQEKQKCSELESRLREYEEIFGVDDPKTDVQSKLKEALEELKLKTVKLEGLEKAQQMMISELETLGKAWSKLEDLTRTHSAREQELIDQNQRQTIENKKLEQKVVLLGKQSNSSNNVILAQKRQSEKQLEQIRKSEELERTLERQLGVLEKQIGTLQSEVQHLKMQVADYTQEVHDLKESIVVLTSNNDQMTALINEKIAEIESLQDIKRKTTEQLQLYKKRYELTQKGEISDIETQLNQYRVLYF